MAGGGVVAAAGGRSAEYNSRFNFHIVLAAIVGASAGLLFGYDIGVTGGVTSMDEFLEKFFPQILEKHHNQVSVDPYCQYDDIQLQMFTSSLFFAGMISAFASIWVNRWVGRRGTMLISAIWFLAGALLTGFAMAFWMLLVGRICLGVGVGLANQSAPVFLSEIAPAKLRGALNIMFQLAVTVGILAAQLINLWTSQFGGWHISLLLAGAPAIITLGGGVFLPDSPNSLAERGKFDKAKRTLQKVRGVDDVDAEYQDIVDAVDEAREHSKNVFAILKRRFRPQLCFSLAIPVFQQLTGINAIMFYAPVIFKSLGFGSNAALLQTVLIGGINLVATFVSIMVVDRLGRRVLFLEGGTQMCIALFISGVCLALGFSDGRATINPDGSKNLAELEGWIYLAMVCIFTAGFAWSWGPMGWLVPTEVQKLETRATGPAINVITNFLATFIIGQLFLTMMCAMKWGIQMFFGGWVVIMTVWVFFFVPETKGVPLEQVDTMFRAHWFWKRYIGDHDLIHDADTEMVGEAKSFARAAAEEQANRDEFNRV